MEQKLFTLPEHLRAPPVFSGVHVTRSLVLCVCFIDRCLSLCTFTFGHWVACSFSNYPFDVFKLFLMLKMYLLIYCYQYNLYVRINLKIFGKTIQHTIVVKYIWSKREIQMFFSFGSSWRKCVKIQKQIGWQFVHVKTPTCKLTIYIRKKIRRI